MSDSLNRSKNQAIEAEAKKKEVEAKMASLDLEKQKIAAEWKDRQATQSKMIAESSERVLAQMKREAEQNKISLEEFYKNEVLKSLSAAILAEAETKIRAGLNTDSHRSINDRFAKELGA